MDNGKEYKNNLIQNFLESLGIESHYTTPNHSNSIGILNKPIPFLLK